MAKIIYYAYYAIMTIVNLIRKLFGLPPVGGPQ